MTPPGHGVLNREQIEQFLAGQPPLLEDMPDLPAQLQPNGVDITVESVGRYRGAGMLARNNANRVLPDVQEIPYDADGWLYLPRGAYQVRFNETVNLPPWLMAYARPRSSLLRAGVALHTAVWDAGYSGRGISLMVVYNPAGFHLARDARICQLVFHVLAAATGQGYTGAYQNEGVAAG